MGCRCLSVCPCETTVCVRRLGLRGSWFSRRDGDTVLASQGHVRPWSPLAMGLSLGVRVPRDPLGSPAHPTSPAQLLLSEPAAPQQRVDLACRRDTAGTPSSHVLSWDAQGMGQPDSPGGCVATTFEQQQHLHLHLPWIFTAVRGASEPQGKLAGPTQLAPRLQSLCSFPRLVRSKAHAHFQTMSLLPRRKQGRICSPCFAPSSQL